MMKRQHSYTRKILCNQRCDSCHKAILFLGLRCKSCRKKYHRKCSECMSTECEKIPFFSSIIKDMTTTIQTTGRDIILSTQPEDLLKQQDRFGNSCHFSELNQSHTVDESLLCRDKTSTFGLEMHCDSHSDPNICTPGVKNANFFGSTADESDLQSVQYHSQASYTNDEDSLLPSSASSIYSSSFYSDSFNSLSGLVTSPNTLPMHSSQFLMPPSPAPSERRHSITSTWPQSAGHHFPMDNTQFSYQGTPVSSPPYNGHNNYERLHLVSGDAFDDQFEELKESLKEWLVLLCDLKFGDRLKTGYKGSIYKGRWHGEVMIHTRENLNKKEISDLWQEVSILSMIRHDNISLFMGACFEPPFYAIITSMRKGHSLYHHTHHRHDKLSMKTKLQIARQIAHGMGYLHAKGIVHTKLCSRNIFLESKVKISITDYSTDNGTSYRSENTSIIPHGHLTYISPELMRTMIVDPPNFNMSMPYTYYSDMYAFGTILYELVAFEWPFAGEPEDVTIWKIGNGCKQSLNHINCPPKLKKIINMCWSHNIAQRPQFVDMAKSLQNNSSMIGSFKSTKKHSMSEPDILHRIP